MGSSCALYVDVDYLLAGVATRFTRTSLRGGVDPGHERLIDVSITSATAKSGQPPVRVHWYDSGHYGTPDAMQTKIGLLPRVEVRLDRIVFDGEQRGFDLRIDADSALLANLSDALGVYDLSDAIHHQLRVRCSDKVDRT